MRGERELRRDAYLRKQRFELASLAERDVNMSGNAFSSCLFVKGSLSGDELAGGPLLGGADGEDLRAALAALGYAPEDWVALGAVGLGSTAPLDAALLREAVCVLDPATVIAVDGVAAMALRAAYATELAGLPDFDAAMLEEGVVAHVLGMRVMALGEFAASLGDGRQKQLMWARLKKLPPLGEPY